MTKRPRIVTSHVYPPIPVRSYDWCAHYDGEEEAGGYGWGSTEEEAVRDFLENCAEDHDQRLSIAADYVLGLALCRLILEKAETEDYDCET